ncbi:MAG TPA: endospore germination permease [Acetivibrio sp.]|nr:endospore germination permease [Acetivibrio sp.]
MKNSKLLPIQVLTLTSSNMLTVNLLTIQQSLVLIAKQDAWISMLLGSAIGLVNALAMYYLSSINQGLDLAEMTLYLGGNWFGRLLLSVSVLYVLIYSGLIIRVFVQALQLFLIDRTPMLVVSILLIIVIVSVVSKGIETVAGVIDILFPFFILSLILLIAISVPQFQIINIRPVLYKNMFNTLKASIPASGALSGFGAIAFTMKYVTEQKKILKWYLSGFFISAGLFILLTASTILVFGPEETQRYLFPTLHLSKSIHVGSILFERLEAFVIILWIPAVFTSVGIYTFTSIRNFVVFFNIKPKHEKYVSLVHIPLLLLVAMFSKNQLEALERMKSFDYIVVCLNFIYIPFLIILTLIKKRRLARVE